MDLKGAVADSLTGGNGGRAAHLPRARGGGGRTCGCQDARSRDQAESVASDSNVAFSNQSSSFRL